MVRHERRLAKIRNNPADVSWADLTGICNMFFGKPRQGRGSHVIDDTPWMDHPVLVLQPRRGKAKAYQVRQVLRAIDVIESDDA